MSQCNTSASASTQTRLNHCITSAALQITSLLFKTEMNECEKTINIPDLMHFIFNAVYCCFFKATEKVKLPWSCSYQTISFLPALQTVHSLYHRLIWLHYSLTAPIPSAPWRKKKEFASWVKYMRASGNHYLHWYPFCQVQGWCISNVAAGRQHCAGMNSPSSLLPSLPRHTAPCLLPEPFAQLFPSLTAFIPDERHSLLR